MPQVSIDWDTVKRTYPMRKPGSGGHLSNAALDKFMEPYRAMTPPGTPCCVQMSHALIAAGCTMPMKSNRRPLPTVTTELGRNYYLMAVDEMEWYLVDNFGAGEPVNVDYSGVSRTVPQMKQLLDGRTGILVFRDHGYGAHTELWDENHMHQRDMSEALFNQPKVLFWDVMITAIA